MAGMDSRAVARNNHAAAMAFAEAADRAAHCGMPDFVLMYRRHAADCERAAALALRDHPECEPSRSVLCRSAAALALEVGRCDGARELVEMGLSGNPPQEIADELREVVTQIVAFEVDEGVE